MKHYQHLNQEERFYIWNALRTGSTQKEVALVLKRSPSTICREIKRNKYGSAKIYTYHWALEILKWRKRRVAKTKHRKSVLVTVVDRTSLYTCCSRVLSKRSEVVSSAIIRILKPHISKVLTLTFNNGTEFVKHEKIARALDADTYFAHPYSSCERAINENTNGLLRQYFPKGTDLRKVTWRDVKKAVDKLNNRPRKTRGYLTPNQLFNNKFVPLI